MSAYPQAERELTRVSHQVPCPICDKPDWCSISADGAVVICMRVDDDALKETANGGWLHILDQKPHRHHHTPTFTSQKEPYQRADPQTLNGVYRDLHVELSLSPSHRKHLVEKRKLTAEDLRKLDYKTLPALEAMSERAPVVNSLVERYGRTLLSVPGFYLTKSERIWLSGTGGLLVPCRDVDGNLVGYQIRVDDTDNGGKYRWLSTPKRKRKRGGVSSGTPIHVAGTDSDSRRVWITEGILKADVAALKLGEIVIGVAGVSSWKRNELKTTLEKLYAREVIIAFDADMRRNKHVERALRKLARTLTTLGYPVFFAEWSIDDGKGIDDLLVNGRQPTIRRYHLPVDLDNLKSIGNEKRIQRIDAPDDDFHRPAFNIQSLREDMRQRITDFARDAEGSGLLVRATQGLGKSTNAVGILNELWQDGILRPVYAAPRHDLIRQLIPHEYHDKYHERIPDGWMHIRPRKPQAKDWQAITPDAGIQLIQDEFSRCTDKPLDTNSLPILCPLWRRADAFGARRRNVVKELCLTDCQIGITYGIDGCPYFMQYRIDEPIATVHETLFIPKFCDDMFGNHQLRLYGHPRQVCVIDEPNPAKFYETVDITPDEISRAIVDAWDKPLKELLDLVRRAAENVAMRLTSEAADEKEQHLIGRNAMEELVYFAGGAEKLEKLLKDAKAEAPSKHEKVVVSLDAFIDERQKSYEVIIAGERRFIPKALADPIDHESMKMVMGYALSQKFPVVSHFEVGEDEDVPLNFCADLLWTLNQEFQRYQTGQGYNSGLVFTVNQKTPLVRLNLRKELAIPAHVPIILLDAQGNAGLLSRLLGRHVDSWQAEIRPDTQITQVVDGVYGITSLWNSKANKPKSTLKRLLKKAILPLCKENPDDVLIITWKKVAGHLRTLQAIGNLSEKVAIEHYGGIEGSNAHENRKTVILLGTPSVSPSALEEMAHALFQNDDAPISMETEERWVSYRYRDCNGHGYQVKVRRYVDDRVEMLARLFREDELVQAAHRIRPALHPDRQIYLFTNMPINELPPAHLITLDELSDSLDVKPEAMIDVSGKMTQAFFDDFAIRFKAEHDDRLTFGSLKPILSQTWLILTKNSTNNQNELRQSLCDLPPNSTLKRWLRDLVRREYWDCSRVIVDRRDPERGGGATWILVYHEGDLEVEAVKAEYQELLAIRKGDTLILEPLTWDELDRLYLDDPYISKWRDRDPPHPTSRGDTDGTNQRPQI